MIPGPVERFTERIPVFSKASHQPAKYAGFEDLSPDDLEEFDLEDFVKRRTQAALEKLKAENIEPNMTADELMKLMRGE